MPPTNMSLVENVFPIMSSSQNFQTKMSLIGPSEVLIGLCQALIGLGQALIDLGQALRGLGRALRCLGQALVVPSRAATQK